MELAKKLKQGQRIVINGIERAYHGSFRCGKVLDFVRPVKGHTVEYCSFNNLQPAGKNRWTGDVFSTCLAEPSCNSALRSGIDLYTRGIRIWKKEVRR